MVIVSKLGFLLDSGSSLRKSSEDSQDVGSLLHGNDSQLIFFVHPNKESFCIVMENTSASWPVPVQTTGFKESISLFEKEVVFNELLLVFL